MPRTLLKCGNHHGGCYVKRHIDEERAEEAEEETLVIVFHGVETVNDKAVVFLPWNTIEPEARQQILNTASMPFVFKHVAVMPDCHYGKGATVGTVLATQGAVIPAAVGVDIGCGMIAVRTPLTRADIAAPSLSLPLSAPPSLTSTLSPPSPVLKEAIVKLISSRFLS